MSKIAVVYWSGTGNTEAMAKLVEEGIAAAGGQADLLLPALFTPDLVSGYDAIAFGCPSMGAEQLEEGEFQPMFDAVKGSLGGKTIGLFGSYGWGDGEWMRTWAEECESLGCRMADEPVIAHDSPNADAADACRDLGKALVG
ncbi:MAG: flavodoxin [Clostridiales bacterium]|nr:flavodoxin [Clostridiales bacterium]